jgi:membrane-associated phospholipid phosphatase
MAGPRIAVAACLICCLSSHAVGDDDGSSVPLASLRLPEGKDIDLSYLWDGGAIPFIWAPLAGRIFLDKYTTPRDSPMMFPSSEGGAHKSDWEIPGYAVTALGGASALGMILSGDPSRMYHVKGLAQSLTTGVFMTGATKVLVGRHRPDWSEERNSDGSRRSFPSGHATQAFAIATYTALYLRGHVFDKYRGDRVLPWYEAATYTGLALGATALAGERVLHNRHHLSDVIVGGLVGTATSALFYWYQDGRYDKKRRDEERKQLVVTPAEKGTGATVGLSWAW